MNQQTTLRVVISMSQGYGPGLQFSEEMDMPVQDFQELAKILSRFHELFVEIKRQKAGAK